jgi:predicted DCC family thiol-disulfide oxidoreductase YuxK
VVKDEGMKTDAINSRESPSPISVLLFDGECGLCNWAVRFVLNHEHKHDLFFAPLTGPLAQRVRDRHPSLQAVDSVIWVDLDAAGEPIRTAIRSTAVLKLFRYLGGWWTVLQAIWIVPRPLRDWIYDLVARNRRRFFPLRDRRVFAAGIEDRFMQ